MATPPPRENSPELSRFPEVMWVLNYGAGNVRSVCNRLTLMGVQWKLVETSSDLQEAANLVFPGVGAFGSAMNELHQRGLVQPLKDFLTGGAPFLGICLGLQCLCSGSEENEGVEGLGIIDAKVKKLRTTARVPHIGWNTLELPQKGFLEDSAPSMNQCDNHRQSRMEACAAKFCLPLSSVSRYYFDHSYCLEANDVPLEWTISQTLYGGLSFVSALRRGNIMATQFHPEKSAQEGEDFFRRFAEICVEFQAQSQREQKCGEEGNFILENGLGRNKKISEEPDGCFGLVTNKVMNPKPASSLSAIDVQTSTTRLAKRVVACLDVRANDDGKMVVTKGLQFAVRGDDGNVRSLGDPVSLSEAYYNQGVDELVFLNITSFRSVPLADFPTLELLRNVSKKVFVPLTIGGGIRDVCDEKSGEIINSSDEIADAYFLAGADKVSIGGDAILAAEEFLSNGRKRTGLTSIERISKRFGSQAVVVSLDPRRKYVSSPEATRHKTIRTKWTGPEGETFCYFECLIRGGREARDIGVFEAAEAVECLGAGEILLNSVDADGRCSGFDLELINGVRACTTIPIIASSGAGTVDHFREVFEQTGVEAALAAGIFHRGETTVKEVKNYLQEKGFAVR